VRYAPSGSRAGSCVRARRYIRRSTRYLDAPRSGTSSSGRTPVAAIRAFADQDGGRPMSPRSRPGMGDQPASAQPGPVGPAAWGLLVASHDSTARWNHGTPYHHSHGFPIGTSVQPSLHLSARGRSPRLNWGGEANCPPKPGTANITMPRSSVVCSERLMRCAKPAFSIVPDDVDW